MKYIVDIKGEIEGDYEIIGKYEERLPEAFTFAQPDVPDTNVGELISRQAAIDELIAFKEAHKADRFTGDFLHWTGIKAMIENLPSAQPSPCEFCKHNNIADDKACLRCSAERRTDE